MDEISGLIEDGINQARDVIGGLKDNLNSDLIENLKDKIPVEYIGIIAIALVGVFLLLLFTLLLKPMKWGFKILINGISGFIGLWLINYFGANIGLNIEINLVSAVLVGALGLPGVLVLVLQQYFM